MVISRRQIVYFPLLVTAAGLQFIKGFVYARLLPVEAFGSLNQALLFASTFANFAGLGFPLLAAKMLPQYYMHGETDHADDLLASAIAVGILASLIGAFAIFVAYLIGLIPSFGWWYAVLFYGAFQYLFIIKLSNIRSELRFTSFALLSCFRAVLFLGGGALTAWLTRDVIATLVYELITTAILSLPIASRTRSREIYRKLGILVSDHQWLSTNLRGALRLLWLSGTLTTACALDKWAGVLLLDQKQYGVYALGVVILTVFDAAQFFINVAAFPIMGHMVAAGQYLASFRFAKQAILTVAVVSCLFYGPFVYAVDWLIHKFLIKYIASTSVIHVLIIAGCFRLADFYGSLAILCNREIVLTRCYLVILVGFSLLIFILHRWAHVDFPPLRIAFIAVGISGTILATNFFIARNSQHVLEALPHAKRI